MKKKILLIYGLLFAMTFPANSGEGLRPGEYIPEGGWGNLNIKTTRGKMLFEITSVGSNFHTCGLSGEIKNNQARLEAADKEKECIVTFTKKGKDIEVIQSGPECSYYCGARAVFEGLYLQPAGGCDTLSRTKTRKRFKDLYDKKEYTGALSTLSELFNVCSKTFDWIETGWIKNDIAITQYKLGDSAACRATLKTLETEAALSDDEIKNNYPPSDADVWLAVVRAARFNLKLCSAKHPKK